MIYKFGWFAKCFVKAKQLTTNGNWVSLMYIGGITLGYITDDKCKGSTD